MVYIAQRTVKMPRRRCMVVVGGSATNRTSRAALPCALHRRHHSPPEVHDFPLTANDGVVFMVFRTSCPVKPCHAIM